MKVKFLNNPINFLDKGSYAAYLNKTFLYMHVNSM